LRKIKTARPGPHGLVLEPHRRDAKLFGVAAFQTTPLQRNKRRPHKHNCALRIARAVMLRRSPDRKKASGKAAGIFMIPMPGRCPIIFAQG